MSATQGPAKYLDTPGTAPESAVLPHSVRPLLNWLDRLADPTRLAAVASASRSLDAIGDAELGPWTRLAARLLRTPVALISVLDSQRQLLKNFQGLGEPWASLGEAPLSHSICKYVVGSDASLAVGDARQAPMLCDNPSVRESGVVAYLGVPLRSNGEAVGTFCVFDVKPRSWDDEDIAMLEEFARAIETQIALSLTNAALTERERTLETVLNLMPAGVVLRDVNGAVLRTNPALSTLLGRSEQELSKIDLWQITHPEDLPGDLSSRAELLRGGLSEVQRRTKRIQHRDGHYLWVRLAAAAMRDAQGVVEGTIAVVEDVTAERDAAAALERQAYIYHAIAQNIPRGAVILFDRELRCIAADGPELFAGLGISKAQLEGRTVQETAQPEHVARLEHIYRQALRGESGEFEGERNGRTLLARSAPVWDGGEIVAGLIFLQDVTEERNQAAAIRRSQALFGATIGNIRDGVVLLDSSWRVLLANGAYTEMFGLNESQLKDLTRAHFIEHVSQLVDDPASFQERILREGGLDALGEEFVLVRPRHRVLRRSPSALELPNGSGTGYLVIWEDVTVENELKAERERQAFTDPLTGIANRRGAERALTRDMACADRAGTPLSVALFDVDHFKQVNDQFGHATGDEVLKVIATCLTREARATDTVARWGGEEFISILPVPLQGAVAFCERVRQAVENTVWAKVGRVTLSAGVAQFGDGEAAEAAIGRADHLLYSAKGQGRNRVCA